MDLHVVNAPAPSKLLWCPGGRVFGWYPVLAASALDKMLSEHPVSMIMRMPLDAESGFAPAMGPFT